MAERDVGTMGECEFAGWCASSGLVANKAGWDAGGWDYVVQFGSPVVPVGVTTLDRIEPPRACWVQVKSTDGRYAPAITLSNWLRMIEPALPFFILLLDFAGQDHPVEASIVHVDLRLVEKVLKRLRELGTADVQLLNAHTMSVPWDDANRLPTPTAAAMLTALKRHLGPNARDYLENKRRWYEDAGYDRQRFTLAFTTAAPSMESAEDQMVDFALGLTKELPCTVTSVKETRFGITAPADDKPYPRDASLRLPEVPSIPGTLEFSDESGTRRVSHPVRFFHPRILLPYLSPDRLRFRIAMANVDIILGAKDTHPSIHVAPLPFTDERRTVAEWARTFRAFKFLAESGQAVTMSLDVLGVQTRWKVWDVQCTPMPAFEVEVIQATLDAATALEVLNVEVDEPVCLAELHHRRHRLAEAAQVLRSKTTEVVLQGVVDGEPPREIVVGHPMTVVIPIGHTLIIVGIAHVGPVQLGAKQGATTEFRVINPQRKLVFVDKITMVDGQTYRGAPWLQKVRDWITGEKIDLLPSPPESPDDE